MKKNELSRYEKGLKGEEIALNFLSLNGYICLANRYKKKGGEIDLILQKDDILVFVEVRVRKSIFEAAESITLKKQHRLTRVAAHFIMHELKEGRSYFYSRFDVVLIDKNGNINHIENAFGVQE